MFAGCSAQNITGSPSSKRPLFKKPSWSKPQALPSGTSLFHRSNQKYADFAVGAERQRKRKAAKKEKEQVQGIEVKERTGKRPRVSESDDGEDSDSASDGSSRSCEGRQVQLNSVHPQSYNETPTVSPTKYIQSPRSLLLRYEASVATNESDIKSNIKAPIFNIVDHEDEDASSGAIGIDEHLESSQSDSLRRDPDDEHASDEEFPELARKAREQARRKSLEEGIISFSRPESLATSQSKSSLSRSMRHPNYPPPPDPIVQIFITSTIPNSMPLIVNRRLSQRLKDVKLAWVERHNFPKDLVDQIFLTWRGKRLFDVTSCRSLGIAAGSHGGITVRGDDVIDDDGRIHMEAMTTDLLEAHKKAKTHDFSKIEQEYIEEPAILQRQEPQVKIICKAKDFADFRLIVKPVCIIAFMCLDVTKMGGSLLSYPKFATPFAHKTKSIRRERSTCCLMGKRYFLIVK